MLSFVKDKNYFVLTTNVDHCFQRAGFQKERLFYTQGDFGLFQCSEPCHNKTYDNQEVILRMAEEQREMKIPKELIPRCPVCGKEMVPNLRADDRFAEDEGWHIACGRYEKFLQENRGKRLLFLELGVGFNTPVIIKLPFLRMTQELENARYACINQNDVYIPEGLNKKALGICGDIREVLDALS